MGPMVISGVVVASDKVPQLRVLGVRDSKVLTRERRRDLYAYLTSTPDIFYASTHITSAEIDMRRRRNETLNEIEASAMLALAKRLYKLAAFAELQLDSVEANTARFARPFESHFGAINVSVLAECGADATHGAVSAASIVAKEERDLAMDEIEMREGCPVGSGYPADAITKRFLADYFRKHNQLPPYIRHTWKLQQIFQ